MDHSSHAMGMDHGHMGHGDMDMGSQCKMNMLFTWSTEDLCIVFPSWHITGPWSLLFSLLAIVLLTAGYEGVRTIAKKYETRKFGGLKDGAVGSIDTEPQPYHDGDEDAQVGREGSFRDVEGAAGGDGGDNRESERPSNSHASLAPARTSSMTERQRRNAKVTMAVFYAVQVFYSFFIMLLFMTYNGWVMLSVAAGAFVGYLMFGDFSAARAVACH